MCFPLFRRTNASLVLFEELSPVLTLPLLTHCEKFGCRLGEEAGWTGTQLSGSLLRCQQAARPLSSFDLHIADVPTNRPAAFAALIPPRT